MVYYVKNNLHAPFLSLFSDFINKKRGLVISHHAPSLLLTILFWFLSEIPCKKPY